MQEEQQFVSLLYGRLDTLRARAAEAVRESLAQVGNGMQARIERDVTVAERGRHVAALDAVESGLCFGRLDFSDGVTRHIGRIGIHDDDEERTPMLIDWRAPVARPFYLATGHTPMGLHRRRHLTTHGRRVTALHDETLALDHFARGGHEDPSGDAVLLSALNSARTGRMSDIVRTIQAEQDEIIRAPHQGVLVVEGGPGTGKTAVALHRAAYLLYAHRERLSRSAVLIVGPNPAFLGYIGEVLPSLGETGVWPATVGELFPGVVATGTDSPRAAAVKGDAAMADVLAAALRDRQELPDPELEIEHEDHGTLVLHRDVAEDARTRARDSLLPHNLARPHFAFRVIDALTRQLADRIGADPFGGPNLLDPSDIAQLGREIAQSPAVQQAVESLWPTLTPQRFLADYLADPTHLPAADADAVRRGPGTWTGEKWTPAPWTPADVPLLDEAAELLGEDDSAARAAAERERRERVEYAQGVLEVAYASRTYEFEDKDDEDSEVLGAQDVIDAERMAERHEEDDHRSAAERAAADRGWAFGHIIVDEAQELSAMAWRLLMRRSPNRSMTLVGDPAQTADAAGLGTWDAILSPYVGDRWEYTRLGVNYRTPVEVMDAAAAVPRARNPEFTPPRSVRSTGVRPWARRTDQVLLASAVAEAVKEETPEDGRLAVIAPAALHAGLTEALPEASWGPVPDLTRAVVLLDPRQAKGLEFDAVLVVEPQEYGTSDLYVALTRATQRLGLLHTAALPEGLAELLDHR
ncbi:UvrD-helicase domain-containing protein [Streptomyces sp. HNM0574]|uniref:HelD family protein n=1 Tax=Streptomyces sp. HNM0574 TaxID=2714954 RepID=UPI001F0E49B4|nr:UvrD-helicase domain-containing protein [Streptomyces sp. HNM0574]